MTHAPAAPPVGPTFVVAVEPDDLAELDRRIPRGMPGCPSLLLRLHPLRAPADQLPAGDVGGLVIVAPSTTALAERVAALATLAHERDIPVVLVRWTGPDDDVEWPLHPVSVVVDVPPDRAHDMRDALVRSFLEIPPTSLPLPRAGFGCLRLLFCEERLPALHRSLEGSRYEHAVLGVVPASQGAQPGPLLLFRGCSTAPRSTGLYPVEDETLDLDPRRYEWSLEPPDEPSAQGRAIAALHVAHGDWRATLGVLDAFANGDVDDAADLLVALSRALNEPRTLRYADVLARAAEQVAARAAAQTAASTTRRARHPAWIAHPPGLDAAGTPWTGDARCAFWADVDAELDESAPDARAPST